MDIDIKVYNFLTINDLAKGNTINQKPYYRKRNGFGGAYIWGFSLDDEPFEIFNEDISDIKNTIGTIHDSPKDCRHFFPYYIGGHKNSVFLRAYEHLCYLRGGNYPIFDPLLCKYPTIKIRNLQKKYKKACTDSYKKVSKTSPPYATPLYTPYPKELLYFPEGVNRYLEFYTGKQIQWQVDWMIRHFCIMFIEPTYDKDVKIDNLETAIGHLKYGNSILFDYTVSQKLPKSPYNSEDQIICKGSKINDFCDLWHQIRGEITRERLGL